MEQEKFVQIAGRLVFAVIRYALRSPVRAGVDKPCFFVAVRAGDNGLGAFLTFEINDNAAVKDARKALVHAVRGTFAEAAVCNRDNAMTFVCRVRAELDDVVLNARIAVHCGRKKQNVGVRLRARLGDHNGLAAYLYGGFLYQVAALDDNIIVAVNGGNKAFARFFGIFAEFVESLVGLVRKALIVRQIRAACAGQTVCGKKVNIGFVFVHNFHHGVRVAERSADGNDKCRSQNFHSIILLFQIAVILHFIIQYSAGIVNSGNRRYHN